MKLLIVTKPMLNKHMEILSYCFRYQSAHEYLDSHPARVMDSVVSLPCLTLLDDVGLNGFTNGYPLFVPINKFALLSDITLQCKQPPEKVIILLDNDMSTDDIFIESIKKLKEQGFRFAIENVANYDKMHPIIELCDFIMISFKRDKDNFGNYMRISKKYTNHTFIASDVDTTQIFDQIKLSGFSSFEGKFYNVPVTKSGSIIAPLKINRIQLINIVRQEDFAIEEVVKIVSQDPSLTISLLKLINSPFLGLSQKVKSIQQAIALLGQIEVGKWVVTATTSLLGEDRPNEITRVSLLRAKFAENLAPHFEMGIHAPGLFLMGLFSLLDVVLEMSMYNALKVVSVSDAIPDALLYRDGDYARVLEFILNYEAANWSEIKRLITLNNLNVEDVFNAYIKTVQWYETIVSAEIEEDSDLG